MGLTLEILNSSLEHADVVLAGNVAVQILADTLAVAHLAEDTAVGRGDTLDGEQGAVGVEGGVHGPKALKLQTAIRYVLLSVGQKTD